MNTTLCTPARLFAALILTCFATNTSTFAADGLQAGDEFVVAQQAPLMRGTQTLATLPQGQKFTVLGTDGDWVGTRAVVNGETVGGWVHRRQVMTPTEYAQRPTVRRRFSYQAGEGAEPYYPSRTSSRNSGSVLDRRLIMGYTPYGPSYWRADRKITGY